MEELKGKYDKFAKALSALQRNLCLVLKPRKDITRAEQESYVAASIKHFELCYETAWKFLRQYLKMQHSIQLDSPKKVIRECFVLKIIDYQTTEELLNMVEARNATIHDYNEETALETCNRIARYYEIFEKLNKIKIEG